MIDSSAASMDKGNNDMATPRCWDCTRDLRSGKAAKTPFVSLDTELILSVKKLADEMQLGNAQYRGVRFCNHTHCISPHISRTHCECALHVLGEEIAPTLQDVLALHPQLTSSSLVAVMIPLSPLKVKELNTQVTVNEIKELGCYDISIGNGDHYYIAPSSEEALGSLSARSDLGKKFEEDFIVTSSMIDEMLRTDSAVIARASEVEVVCLSLKGHEDTMENWPFLSTTAVHRLLELFVGAKVVVLNTPSIDRESDGGMVPNHKAVFCPESLHLPASRNIEVESHKSLERLIVELANFSSLDLAKPCLGNIQLSITPHPSYLDCGDCKVSFHEG